MFYFAVYSFIGWCIESTYVSIARKEWVNSGFLYGPFIPIYGFGALFSVYVLYPYRQYPFVIFLVSILACSCIEYFTSWLLEQVFHILWWDYSSHRFHFHGRICLLNSLLFGLLSLLLVYFVHPFLLKIIVFPISLISLFLGIYLLLDFLYSLSQLITFQQHPNEFKQATLLFHNKIVNNEINPSILRLKRAFPQSKICYNEDIKRRGRD